MNIHSSRDTGAICGRDPDKQNTGPLHLWEKNEGAMVSSCGQLTCEIAERSQSSLVIRGQSGNTKELDVIPMSSFEQSVTGYCQECLQNHPVSRRVRR